jgi:hypothetical protein
MSVDVAADPVLSLVGADHDLVRHPVSLAQRTFSSGSEGVYAPPILCKNCVPEKNKRREWSRVIVFESLIKER